jgi:lipopolysaccharide export LptBFGC system permease protein LptF
LQVVPWGFRKLLNWIAKEYNNPPVLIKENGFSDHGELDDRDRVDYLIVSGSNSGLLSKSVECSPLESFLANRGFKPSVLCNSMF